MARVALIDGDSFAYRLAAAVEKTLYMVEKPIGNGGAAMMDEYATHKAAVAAAADTGVIWSRKQSGTLKEAADGLERSLERSIARAQCSVFHVYIGGSGPTFRDHLARIRKYKGTRTGSAPSLLSDLRTYITRQWGAVTASGEEADDMLCYTARELTSEGQNVPVIIGNDKDLDQIPGEHYDWVSDKLYSVSDAEARLRMWVQVLSGDLVDNIAGCWKVGASKANRTVRECIEEHGFSDADMWKFVCTAYEESQEYPGCPYVNLDPIDVALENYNLVRLRQNRWEKHNYLGLFVRPKEIVRDDRGLFVREKEKKRPLTAGGNEVANAVTAAARESSKSTSSQGGPSACAASEKACFGTTQDEGKVPIEVGSDDYSGLGQEEDSV